MYVALLVLKNALRHKLRTILTVVGIVVAITAFGLLRTIVDAWYAGANASSSARLVTRNAVSLVFSMPVTYAQKIRQVQGVASVALANWFGGVYISERNFFPQFAISVPAYLEMYPEFILSPEEKKAFLTDRTGALAGRKLAEQYGWKIGDQVPLRGTIFPGAWTLRRICDAQSARLRKWIRGAHDLRRVACDCVCRRNRRHRADVSARARFRRRNGFVVSDFFRKRRHRADAIRRRDSHRRSRCLHPGMESGAGADCRRAARRRVSGRRGAPLCGDRRQTRIAFCGR